jgi:hypothetical protein
MALTNQEKLYAEIYLAYYSGKYPNIPQNTDKIEQFIYSNEEEKKIIIKGFIRDTIIPQAQVNKTSVENTLTKITNEITEYSNYIK